MKKALLGQIAPLLAVSEWVQGEASNFDKLTGQVVLVEVFQVNCPGCFLYSLPLAIDLYRRYQGQGLVVLGLATAFEDFDKNTLQNLNGLLKTGQVVGETLRTLAEHDQLNDGKWLQRIPFPVAMDSLVKAGQTVSEQDIDRYIQEHVPNLMQQSSAYQQQIRQRILQYLQQLEFRAETFERFGLQGTPSHILLDKQGILRDCRFGAFSELESRIQHLLAETVS